MISKMVFMPEFHPATPAEHCAVPFDDLEHRAQLDAEGWRFVAVTRNAHGDGFDAHFERSNEGESLALLLSLSERWIAC
jgi:hypothetical protein